MRTNDKPVDVPISTAVADVLVNEFKMSVIELLLVFVFVSVSVLSVVVEVFGTGVVAVVLVAVLHIVPAHPFGHV